MPWKNESGEESLNFFQAGYLPEGLINYLILLGWSPKEHEDVFSIDDIIHEFALCDVSKSGAKFDLKKCQWVNHQYIIQTCSRSIFDRLNQLEMIPSHWNATEDDLLSVIDLTKDRLNTLQDFPTNAAYFFVEPKPDLKHQLLSKVDVNALKQILESFLSQLEEMDYPLNSGDFEALLQNILNTHDLKLGKFLKPIRYLTTGVEMGPPLFKIFEFLGQNKIKRRIQQCLS